VGFIAPAVSLDESSTTTTDIETTIATGVVPDSGPYPAISACVDVLHEAAGIVALNPLYDQWVAVFAIPGVVRLAVTVMSTEPPALLDSALLRHEWRSAIRCPPRAPSLVVHWAPATS